MKIFSAFLFIILCFTTIGCEKLKYKMAQRETRQQYFKDYLDSSRKQTYKRNDSIRRALLRQDSVAANR
ncbi:MAG: hypothetical protein JNL36_01905 [Candidatus Kapabacteria bacterium]|nr:hypothetical protein [Candidatus Kapabacteria bacterium]